MTIGHQPGFGDAKPPHWRSLYDIALEIYIRSVAASGVVGTPVLFNYERAVEESFGAAAAFFDHADGAAKRARDARGHE